MEDGKFSEIMTDTLYFHRSNILWDLQTPVLAYAKATDQLSGSNYYEEFMALDEDQNGVIDDSEFGRKGSVDCVIALLGIDVSLIGKGEVEHGIFFFNSRYLKYADPAWNVRKLDTFRVFWDAGAFPVALQMAADKENQGTDPFFGIPYGAVDGALKWPSLQFARYSLEMFIIHEVLYSNVAAYSKKTGKTFKLFVPSQVPYAPATPADKPPWSYNPQKLSNVVELDPKAPDYSKRVFTVEFSEGNW
jgi:hypothetical protein